MQVLIAPQYNRLGKRPNSKRVHSKTENGLLQQHPSTNKTYIEVNVYQP